MNAIRMLALDLDDTLLRSDLTISFHTRNLVRKAAERGMVIALASGRVFPAVETYLRQLGLLTNRGYAITSNGIEIRESDTGNLVFQNRLPGPVAELVYRYADAEGFPVQVYEGDVIYVSRRNEYADYDQSITGLRQEVDEHFAGRVGAGCGKMIIPGDPMILRPMESILRSYLGDRITLFTSKPYFLEIMPWHCDKGSALAQLAGRLEIPRESVMAVGDSMNDEAMIRWAGMGVAMKNGDERLKRSAALVTARSNDEDGVAAIIENILGSGGDMPATGAAVRPGFPAAGAEPEP